MSGVLHHFSEDASIRRFVPHVPATNPDQAPAVWAIEEAWLERMRTVELFRYDLPATTFERWEEASGQWISRAEVVPSSVSPTGDLLTLHEQAGIELRVLASLWPIREFAVSDEWDFSIVRMRNAA